MNNPIRILIAEHDVHDVELLYHELKTGGINYISEVVQNEQNYIHAIKHFIPDIILADYTFPSFNGPMAFKIREQLASDTPFIFVSGTIGEERSIEHIRTGVTDYVLKDKLFTLNFKLLRALKETKEKQQKKETEQRLILSERLLARAQQIAHMGNWQLDFSSNTVRCSDETCRIYGLPPVQNNLSKEGGLQFVHVEDAAYVKKKIEESRELLLDLSVHYRIIRTDGSIRYLNSEGKHEFDANGLSTGLYGIVQDVTEMVLMEKKLSEERLIRQKEIANAVLTALENERVRIGYELNENLSQILAAAKVYIHLSGRKTDKRQLYLDMSIGFVQDVIVQIRKISKTLLIPAPHITSVVDNIKNLIHDLSLVHPIVIEFKDGDIDTGLLNEKLQLTILRIVQEQINNILVHSNAAGAEIHLHTTDDKIILRISDNGEGYDILKENDGVGIINIKTRAEWYDGKVDIISGLGQGYELKVELFLKSNMSKPGAVKTV